MPRYSLESFILVLLIVWLVGWLLLPVGGPLVHLLLALAVIVFVIRLVQGRRPRR